jgi:hypothetical protein
MALKIVDFFEEAGVPGVIAGIGAVILAPVVIPVVAGVGKPLAKSVLKGGIVLYEKSKGALAEVGESIEDLVAEAKAEIAEQEQNVEFKSAEPSPNEIHNHGDLPA